MIRYLPSLVRATIAGQETTNGRAEFSRENSIAVESFESVARKHQPWRGWADVRYPSDPATLAALVTAHASGPTVPVVVETERGALRFDAFLQMVWDGKEIAVNAYAAGPVEGDLP